MAILSYKIKQLQNIIRKATFLGLSGIFSILFIYSPFTFSQTTPAVNKTWVTNPFENKEFIENKGQFTKISTLLDEPALYAINRDGVQIYFTAKGLSYRYDEYKRKADDHEAGKSIEEELKEKEIELIHHNVQMEWQNSNPNVQVVALDPLSYYCTYSDPSDPSHKKTIIAPVFKKIIYKNLYPGIDVEYFFPENKAGFKYNIILHPGADVSKLKMKYANAKKVSLDEMGNIIIKSDFGPITDHAPVTSVNNKPLASSFDLHNNTVTFKLSGDYNSSETILIDPWVTNPAFTTNKAYDVDYDKYGNVYAYGSYTPYQCVKINNAGTILWKYSATTFSATNYYGDFLVDFNSSMCYLFEGFNTNGAQALKLSPNGTVVASSLGSTDIQEYWRAAYNLCTKSAIIAGGGTAKAYQACILDSTLAKLTPVNVLSATGPLHDIALLTIDNSANCYMLSARSVVDPTFADNYLFKVPAATLSPNIFGVNGNHAFIEVGSITYVGPTVSGSSGIANGMNGIAANNNFLTTYDGFTLKKWNKTTGAFITQSNIGTVAFRYGGLDISDCDNIYAGVHKSIKILDANLNLTSTITLPDTVFDLKLNNADKLVYATGIGYVTAIAITENCIDTVKATVSSTGTCPGSSGGTATANATGGSGTNYTYAWNTGQTTQTITGLTPGTYTVTVTNNFLQSCTPIKLTTTQSVTVPAAGTTLTYNLTSTPSCFNSANGSIVANVSSGTGPYTYSWSGTTQTTASVTGLNGGGSYTVTITDAGGCTATSSSTVPQLTAITYNLTGTNASCGSNNGTATVASVTGGSGSGYSYSWSSTGTGVTETNLSGGTYTVTITDGSGCTASSTLTINNNSGPTATMGTPVNISCYAGNNGSVTVTAAGASANYSYSWSNGTNTVTGSTNNTITGLSAGTYIVTITDAGGCTATTTAVITQPAKLSLTANGSATKCKSSCDGLATVIPGGGTNPITIAWSTSGTSQTINGLCAGTYSVTITDANACKKDSTVVVNEPAALTLSTTNTAADCNQSNGTATVTASGATAGTSGYTYNWSTGSSSPTAGNLAPGTYTVTVSDQNNCNSTTTVTILNNNGVIASIQNVTSASCSGSCNATAAAQANSGTAPYQYSWTSSATNQTAANLCSGSYTVTISDSKNCTSTAVATITEPTAITALTTSVSAKCGNPNGSASVTASGGTGNFTFNWSNIVAGTTSTGLLAGIYSVTVNDANGCSIVETVSILNIPGGTASTSVLSNVACAGESNGSAVANITGGTSPFNYTWSNGASTATVNTFAQGIYTVTISDSNGCISTTTINITEPSVITTVTSPSASTCGNPNGSASVTASGGTGAFTFNWSNGAAGETSLALLAGTYSVTVNDANGCSKIETVTIANIGGGTASTSLLSNVTCYGDNNGSATASIAGGVAPFNYTWSNGATTATVNTFAQGTYTVTVSDANNCLTTSTVIITQPAALSLPAIQPETLCIGQSKTLTSNPSGGTPGYTISWMPGSQSGAAISVQLTQPTTYTINVTDANGCTTTAQKVTINLNPPLNASIASISPVCPGGNVNLNSQAAGGNGNYSYTWLTNPVQNTQNITVTANTQQTYTVVVNDNCGTPPDSAIVTLNLHPVPQVKFTADVTQGCPGLCVNFSDQSTISSGTITQWLWNFSTGKSASQNPTNCFRVPGKYTIYLKTISDNGCSSTDSIVQMIHVFPNPTAAFTTTPDSVAIVDPKFQFNDQSSGATSWLWNFGDPADDKTSTLQNPDHKYSEIGTYCTILKVQNQQGCVDSTEHCVVVVPEFIFYIPNAFTPNDDNINDRFTGTGIGINAFKMSIFDRWGKMIFSTDNINDPWDGKANKGQEVAQQDVYSYLVEITDIFEKPHRIVGHVSLIR